MICELCDSPSARKIRARIRPWRVQCFELCKECEPKLVELIQTLRENQTKE